MRRLLSATAILGLIFACAVSAQRAEACSTGFSIKENRDLEDLSSSIYPTNSLWEAVKNPPQKRGRRSEARLASPYSLFNIPCPQDIEHRTRTPGIDLQYAPKLAVYRGSQERQRLSIFKVSRVRPVAQSEVPGVLPRPTFAALPQMDASTPGPNRSPKVYAVGPQGLIAPVARMAFRAELEMVTPPERSPRPNLTPETALTRNTAFALDSSVPSPGAQELPLAEKIAEANKLIARPLPPAVARATGKAPPAQPVQSVRDAKPFRPLEVSRPIDETTGKTDLPDIAAALASVSTAVEQAETLLATRKRTRDTLENSALSVRIATGNDFRPFNDRSLPEGGLITDVVARAFAATDATTEMDVNWIEGWAGRIGEVLSEQGADIAFPVPKPDCNESAGRAICDAYLFSEPVFEYVVQLFVDVRNPIRFERDSDLVGRRLCRPEGFPTHMMDENGRNWIKEQTVTLVQPRLVSDCFFMLASGEVDGVVLNRVTAQDTILSMGLGERIKAVAERPMTVSGLHAVALRDNPQAAELIRRINEGLSKMRSDGTFGRVVSGHLRAIWDRI